MDSLKEIELTEEEIEEAMLWAKNKKQERLKYETREKIAEENRRALISSKWPYDQTKAFMEYRKVNVLNGFVIDEVNRPVFELLCYYFSEDARFEAEAINLGVKNPGLHKGIMLVGNCGVGKTWMMRLFSKNKRQVYLIKNAKEIADQFEEYGQEAIQEYLSKVKNAVNDVHSFYQTFSGICLDDIGTEDIKNHFGNKKNIIGDIIEKRYSTGDIGLFLHGTTNLTIDEFESFYGPRVRSRIREIFNWIVVPGEDRRK